MEKILTRWDGCIIHNKFREADKKGNSIFLARVEKIREN
jgi:hypothetical protein